MSGCHGCSGIRCFPGQIAGADGANHPAMTSTLPLALPLVHFADLLKSVLTGGLAITFALFFLRAAWEFLRKRSL